MPKGHVKKPVEFIDSIMWGAHFYLALRGSGESALLILKPLSLKDKNFVEFVYKQALDEAHSLDIMSEFEFRNRLKSKGMWDETQDEAIKVMMVRVKELRDSLKNMQKGSRSHKITTRLMAAHSKTLEQELRRKAELFYITSEQYADEVRNRAIVFCSAHNEHEEKVWPSWESFLNENDTEFIGNIIAGINKLPILEVKEIRSVARSPEWRYLWNAAKGNIQALFDKPICQFDVDQKNLTYWSQSYDSVFEAYERPSDDVINDDEALDKWFEDQAKKNKQERLERGEKVGELKLSDKIAKHGEIFIVANPAMNPDNEFRKQTPNTPSIQEIESMNSGMARTLKRKELETIQEKKMVSEKDLRKRGNKIARQLIGSQDAIVGKRSQFSGQAKGKAKIMPGGTL